MADFIDSLSELDFINNFSYAYTSFIQIFLKRVTSKCHPQQESAA